MTVVQGNGYSPNILAIDPSGGANLDLLRSSGAEQFYAGDLATARPAAHSDCK